MTFLAAVFAAPVGPILQDGGLGGVTIALAAECEDDTLDKVAADGEILVMLSGAVYRVLPGDTIDSALWLPPADVIICEKKITVKGKGMLYYEIINVDDREKVGATRLR